MAFGLEAQGPDQGVAQALAVPRITTDQGLEIQRVVVTQTEHQLALGGDPHAVAIATEVVAMRRDKADVRPCALHPPIARRPAGLLTAAHQRMARLDTLAHLVA